MKEPIWIDRRLCGIAHNALLASYGGQDGVRDEGLLESALAKPRQRFAYGQPDLFELAAAYAYGIVKNHPFLDGNKRTGFVACVFFLEKNGQRFVAPEVDAVLKTVALAAGDCSETEYAAWLRDNSRPAA
jgi:death-on-curing protein